MQTLTLARQRLRAQLQSPSTPRPVRLAHDLVEDGKGRFLPILSSPLAQEILSRGYDARVLDRVYANRPSGELGLMGRLADRVILDLPFHHGIRERLEAASGEICAAAVPAIRSGQPEFRLLSAPCGLAFEMTETARLLREDREDVLARLRCWGVDPDPQGDLLREAARRTRAAGLDARFIHEDLRRHREVSAVVEREGPFHLVSLLGVSPFQSLEETADLVRYYTGILAAEGTLLVDRWEPAEKSRVGAGLGIGVKCPPVREFHAMLRGFGLTVEREHPTGEGGCVLVVARKVLPA